MDRQKEVMILSEILFRGKLKFCFVACVFGLLTPLTPAYGGCSSLIKGPIAVDVQTCGVVNPDKFDVKKDKFKFISDLDPEGRKLILEQYRGLAVKGTIVRSQAVREGLDTKKGVLQGHSLLLYIPPGQGQCAGMVGKRVVGTLEEKCCDGNPEAPCLLGTGITLKDLKIGQETVVSADGTPTAVGKTTKERGTDYKEAERHFALKKYKIASFLFRKADAANDIDVKGLLHWGTALRELEDCPSAIEPLKKLFDRTQKGKLWAAEELDSRRGIFLLARCHAKLNEPSSAVFYLNGFLLDPKKYRAELQQSLKHKDFGWIHTSKEYIEYRNEAQKKL